MFRRIVKLSKNNSLFLFGARGTGKTTLIQEKYGGPKTLWIDLLKDEEEERFRKNPDLLSTILKSNRYDWVVIDEIQKIPKLLDIVHLEIEKKKSKFVLTSSSARKLKRGSANLLAGRAFSYHLFPLTHRELADVFDLETVLRFGSLPRLYELRNEEDKQEFLRGYISTYLKEEILQEQLIRNIEPFRDFLPVSAQVSGKIVSFSKIARDIGTDDKTVKNYFQILEDTLLGFFLPSYHRSVRKRQKQSPKFYLFDLGVTKALNKTLTVPLEAGTYAYGSAFEHFIICETLRLNEYLRKDFSFYYLRTKDDAEVDLIIERPGQSTLLIEIKSSNQIYPQDVSCLKRFQKDWQGLCETQCWCRIGNKIVIDGVLVLPWKEALEALFKNELVFGKVA